MLLYLNNHFSAKAVANAALLKHRVGQPLPGDYPARDGRPLSGTARRRRYFWAGALIVTFLITSVTCSLSTTAIPAIT